MNGFELITEIDENDFATPRFYRCTTCDAVLPSGIITLSGHWAECAGKGFVDNIKKIDKIPLSVKDKMDLVKNNFNITQ